MQVLEGERSVVKALFETIEKDPRHRAILLVSERAVPERVFGEWAMGYTNLDDMDLTDVPGYTQFLNVPLNSEEFRTGSRAYTFLMTFKQYTR